MSDTTSWWERNATAKADPGTSAGDFYDASYKSATEQAAPTSDARTGETFDRSTGPKTGFPFGRPSS
ncbi:hypothetical protein [Kitasatospora griseola]|uniref:hypothetical protein n=1 Tax=Kitasatospora griseola TaxID=2064 RepID=UPI003828BE50